MGEAMLHSNKRNSEGVTTRKEFVFSETEQI